MNRARLLHNIQQHPNDPALLLAMSEHEFAKAVAADAAGDTLKARVVFDRASYWETRAKAVQKELDELAAKALAVKALAAEPALAIA